MEKTEAKEQPKQKGINEYGEFTVGKLVRCLLELMKQDENITADTPVYLSDFECNNRQTKFEIMMAEGHPELYIWYEMHEGEWPME